MRTEKKEITEKNNLKSKPYESQNIKSINIKLNEKPKIQEQKLELRKYSKSKNDKKSFIRVQKQELDDYIKGQIEISDLNVKMEKIKEKQELVINKLRKIEEKKRKEESLQKLYESQKSNTSYDYYAKSKRFKNLLYMNNRSKKDIGSYSITRLPKEKHIEKENDIKIKLLNLREKLKEKRSKSFQQLVEKSLENRIKNILTEKRSKNKKSLNIINRINKKYKTNKNENYVFRNINKFKGEDDINIKESFKRFRKMVVHLKKRNNLDSNTEGNFNRSENKIIKSNYPHTDMKTSKTNKTIQNIYYNMFYNCLFNGEHNNYTNIKNIHMNNNNKKNKEFKSISSEKNIFRYKNLFELNINKNIHTKKYEYQNNLNKENDLVNYNTERKRGNLFSNNINSGYEKKNYEKNKVKYEYTNYKNNLINSDLINTPSHKMNIIT